jgi:hypothetical protein
VAEISNRAVATAAGGALLAVVLAFVSPSEGSHRTDYDETVRCPGKTVRDVQVQNRSSEAVVFTKVKRYEQGTLPTTYACLLRRGAPLVRLDRPTADKVLDPHLAGAFVGFKRVHQVSGPGWSTLSVVDLRSGRVHHELGATDIDERDQVRAIVLKRNGSVAWIGETEKNVQQVWRLQNGEPGVPIAKLDTSPPRIEPLSLRLTGDRRTVRWAKGGQPASAPIN